VELLRRLLETWVEKKQHDSEYIITVLYIAEFHSHKLPAGSLKSKSKLTTKNAKVATP